MSEMKCPFCGQELTVYEYSAFTNVGFLPCEKCRIEGTKEMWEALIRTRKMLDVAVGALKSIDWCGQDYANAQGALEEIMALEQKDVK